MRPTSNRLGFTIARSYQIITSISDQFVCRKEQNKKKQQQATPTSNDYLFLPRPSTSTFVCLKWTWWKTCTSGYISQLPKLCVKISILRHRRMWVSSFSTRLTSVTFAEDKVLIFLILRKNAKIVQLLSLTIILTLISRADWSDKLEWYIVERYIVF